MEKYVVKCKKLYNEDLKIEVMAVDKPDAVRLAACEQNCRYRKRCVDNRSDMTKQVLNLKRAEISVSAAL